MSRYNHLSLEELEADLAALEVAIEAKGGKAAERHPDRDAALKLLAELCFADMGCDDGHPKTTQEVWEIISRDRVQDWFSFEDLDAARRLLAMDTLLAIDGPLYGEDEA